MTRITLPRFFSRVVDAVAPIATVSREALAAHLTNHRVAVHAPEQCQDDPAAAAGALLAINLAARLYPRVHLLGPGRWTDEAGELACAINPDIDLLAGTAGNTATKDTVALCWDDPVTSLADAVHLVQVGASGWNVAVDTPGLPGGQAHPLAELAASALGVGEVFRVMFAESLGAAGRHRSQPGGFNLITGSEPAADLPVDHDPAVPDLHLVGAGAVGQACALGLIAAGVRGQLSVVDPEAIELSNMQRYVLTVDTDEGVAKTTLVSRAAQGSGLSVAEVPTAWGADDRSGPGASVALVALDSATDRIGVAASLPGKIYNSWTQPADTGWSRHEAFGVEPCLACLYYPSRPRPHEYQLIAAALRQPELRVLSYLVQQRPVGDPLPRIVDVPDLPPPPEAPKWRQQPLLADLVSAGLIDASEADQWAPRRIVDLYRDGVCAGGLIRPTTSQDDQTALVPLAHQSALAGLMLAVQLVAASNDNLRDRRPAAIEMRLDQLRGLPQLLTRPRAKTAGCLCSDPTFISASRGGLTTS